MKKKEKKTEVVTFRTTPEIKEYLEIESEKVEQTPAWLANKIITQYVKEHKKGTIQFNITHNETININ